MDDRDARMYELESYIVQNYRHYNKLKHARRDVYIFIEIQNVDGTFIEVSYILIN